MATPRICSVDGCGKRISAKGYCSSHYHRLYRYGDPLGGGLAHGHAIRFLYEVALKYEGMECLKWPFGTTNHGYPIVTYNGAQTVASRAVCIEAHGPPPSPEHEAAHSCGKGHEGCVTKRHLSWKTPVQNAADTIAHGTRCYGSKQGRSKLTDEDVRAIRGMLGSSPQAAIADLFGVTQSNVSAIKRGKSWSFLD